MRWLWGSVFTLILAAGVAGYWYVFEREIEPIELTVAAGSRDSDTFQLMTEISQVLQRHSENVRLKVVTSPNSSESTAQVSRREIDLATIEANTPAYTTINLVADLFEDYYLLISREARTSEDGLLSYNTVNDLPLGAVAIPESGTSENRAFWSVVDHYKVAPESIRTLAVDHDKATELFLGGAVNAIFLQSSLRDPFLLSLIEQAGLRGIKLKFIEIDQAEAMKLKRPYLSPVTVVKGAFDGKLPLPKRDVIVPSLHRVLVAGSHVDEDAINELVTVIFENRLDLLIRMPLSSRISNPRDSDTPGLALHAGAARYFDRDQPHFIQENAEPLALAVTVFGLSLSALFALRRNLRNRAKNKADDYNDTLLAIVARVHTTDDIEALRNMRRELESVLETIVHALDNDHVTEEGFQSFSFLWSSVRDTINERITDLRSA